MIHQADTLLCNQERLAAWQADPACAYNRELIVPEMNIWDRLMSLFAKLLGKIFGSNFADAYGGAVLISLFVLAVLLVLWFVYRKNPGFFMRSSRKRVDYTIHEDTIYGIDFSSAIAAALKNGDYREAVRYLYLQSLKELNDDKVIDWQLYKTPTEYVYEVPSGNGREYFRQLTARFLRVRYGNFEATESLFGEMQALWAQMKEGGKA